MSQARRTTVFVLFYLFFVFIYLFFFFFFFFLLFFLVLSPEQISKPNFCALHNFLMIWKILIIFGRGIDKDQ